MERMCDECGRKLPVNADWSRRYCDRKCRDRNYYVRNKKWMLARQKGLTCAVCGGPRSNHSDCLPEGQGRCGSCRQAAARAKEQRIKAARIKPCAICEKVFEAKHASALYCSEECRAEGYRRHGRKRKPHTLTTTQRGYTAEHQRVRKRKLEALVPGTSCELCREPMFADQELDLDHSDPDSRWRGEPGDRLTHASCNRRQGARRAKGCDCEVCSGEYAALAGQCCVRSKKWISMTASPRPKRERVIPPPVPICVKDCVVCGTLFTAHGKFAERRKSCGAHTSSEVAAARYRNEPGFREKAIENALARYHGDPEYRAKTIGRVKQQRHRDKDVPAYIRYHGDAVDSKQQVLQRI